MSLPRLLIVVFSLCLIVSRTHAEVPPRSKANLRNDAQLVVVAKVSSVSISVEGQANFTDWMADISAEVLAVEKGERSDVSDPLTVRCHRWKQRPAGFVGPSGHWGVPAKDSKVRLYLSKREDGIWEPLLPNGIEMIDGQPLDFKTAEIVQKPLTSQEMYVATKGKKRFVRRGKIWMLEDGDKPATEFVEHGRDLKWIYIQNHERGDMAWIPRRGGQVLGEIAIGEQRMKNLFEVQRTVPKVTGKDFEAFKVVLQKAEETTPVVDGPLVVPSPPERVFLRVGNIWEQLDLSYDEVLARYQEQYRDSQQIQLHLIVEEEWQKPHTLTILRTETGGTVVLRNGDLFKKFQLEFVVAP